MTHSGQKLLEVKDLQISFPSSDESIDNQALKGIGFSLNRGETLGIVGESGSGKSITALTIMRLLESPPAQIDTGEIWYYPKEGEKRNLLECSEKEMQRLRGNHLGMIFQEPMTALNPIFRCGHQVDEALMLHQKLSRKAAKAKTLDWFEKVQLPDPERIYKSYPHQLSGGQKQRVLIAIALCCHPDLLIADEPTTALDVTVQKEILQLINDLKAQFNISIIFISHDLGVIAEIADRVVVMQKGEIVENGEVKELFLHPKHPYTKGLLACRPPVDYKLRRLPMVSDFIKPDDQKTNYKEIKLTLEEVKTERAEHYKKAPIIEVNELHTWFSRKNWLGTETSIVKAVNDVSFQVYPGEIVGLVGESGCGKTTLGRSVIRLQKVDSGNIKFKGTDLITLSPQALKKLRPQMQIVFQDPYSSLNPRMTVGEAIKEPLVVHQRLSTDQERRDLVIDLLERVGLEAEHYYRYPHEFSGGQRQRICIARALVLQPEFIVFDESVSALDVSVQAQILNLILDLKESLGFSCIFISHDLSVVKFISDRMMVMKDGKIVEEGWPEDIYSRPKSAYTRKLIEAIPKGI